MATADHCEPRAPASRTPVALVFALLAGAGSRAHAQSLDVDRKLGAEAAAEVESVYGIVQHPQATAYVAAVGERLVATLGEQPFEWSNYAETAGLRDTPDWLEVDWTLAQFGRRRDEARRRFREFVAEGKSADYRPWQELRGGWGSLRGVYCSDTPSRTDAVRSEFRKSALAPVRRWSSAPNHHPET